MLIKTVQNKRVIHLTSAHRRYDTRIFLKECQSLVDAGYEVSLIVADNKGDEVKNGVSIFDVGLSSGGLTLADYSNNKTGV